MPAPKILVVDDEEEICSLTKSFLEKRGHSVLTATTQEEALDLVGRESPQLILLDLRLKGATGIEVLEKIRRLDLKVKVILVTALRDEESVSRARALGVEDFVAKPFSVDFLDQLIKSKIS